MIDLNNFLSTEIKISFGLVPERPSSGSVMYNWDPQEGKWFLSLKNPDCRFWVQDKTGVEKPQTTFGSFDSIEEAMLFNSSGMIDCIDYLPDGKPVRGEKPF